MGDAVATQELLTKVQSLQKQNRLKLVYASGRSFERIQQLKLEENLIEPDGIIAAVGTEIYLQGTPLIDWAKTFNYKWDREAIFELCSRSLNFKPQANSEQRPYKISLETDTPKQENIEALRSLLRQAFPEVTLLSSHAGRYVDVVPQYSDKGRAVRFLADMWRIDPGSIYVAGDSSNDISMLSQFNALVVGNAYDEVRSWYDAHPELPVYFAHNYFAAGVNEGLTHYFGKNWGEL